MTDLINRQGAIDAVYDIVGYLDWEARGAVAYVLSGLPSVQPERKGEWIRGDAEKLTGKWRCSICGNTIYSETKRDREKFHAFCGHCGAKMN